MSSNITLVTGGSRSGKSQYAEKIYKEHHDVLYIATAIVTDEEMKSRINQHKSSRNQCWETAEAYKDLDQVISAAHQQNILLDCVTVMVTNLMFDQKENVEEMSPGELVILEQSIIGEFQKIIDSVKAQNKNLVLVTNELGYGLVPDYKLGRIFRDMAGRINQQLAKWSDQVYLVACGLPLKLK